MKKSILFLLAVVIFGCGYLFGHMEQSPFQANNAHAYSNYTPGTFDCSGISVARSCGTESGTKVLSIIISGVARDTVWSLGYGTATSKSQTVVRLNIK